MTSEKFYYLDAVYENKRYTQIRLNANQQFELGIQTRNPHFDSSDLTFRLPSDFYTAYSASNTRFFKQKSDIVFDPGTGNIVFHSKKIAETGSLKALKGFGFGHKAVRSVHVSATTSSEVEKGEIREISSVSGPTFGWSGSKGFEVSEGLGTIGAEMVASPEAENQSGIRIAFTVDYGSDCQTFIADGT